MIGLLVLLLVLGVVVALVEGPRGSQSVDPGYRVAIRIVAALIVLWYLAGLLGIPPGWPRTWPR